MILDAIVDHVSPSIIALPWVERYAKVVEPINKKPAGSKDYKTYPVACDVVNGDCATKEPYDALTPDSKVMTIVYWEPLSDVVTVPKKNTKTGQVFKGWEVASGQARIVVWGNLKKLGLAGCKLPIQMLLELKKIVNINKREITFGSSVATLEMQSYKVPPKDINKAFGKYTYEKKVNYYMKPYDFFTLDVRFALTYCVNAGDSFIPQPPLDC